MRLIKVVHLPKKWISKVFNKHDFWVWKLKFHDLKAPSATVSIQKFEFSFKTYSLYLIKFIYSIKPLLYPRIRNSITHLAWGPKIWDDSDGVSWNLMRFHEFFFQINMELRNRKRRMLTWKKYKKCWLDKSTCT